MAELYPNPMTKAEKIAGWIWVFIHTFLLGYLLSVAGDALLPHFGLEMTEDWLNLAYYVTSALFSLLALGRFMRLSFHVLCEHPFRSLLIAAAAFFAYQAMALAAESLVGALCGTEVNPNTEAVMDSVRSSYRLMLALTVILGPIAEEVLFRGVVFGSIAEKHRLLAYVISTALFAVYHLWEYVFYTGDTSAFIYLIEYIPAGIALGWCYDKSRNIWTPIALHGFLNYLAVRASIG